ncbi:MAG TPA: Hsp20/alpha crystallin family protein [Gemmataceae bacterium]|jgi:HSP20 family protein|nr:Hsp20/alpha crystallin family protein [Gemmataceae bacterium]
MKALIPWRRTTGVLEPYRLQMEDLFERFFGPAETEGNGLTKVWAPRVDVAETEKEVFVKAELPGVDPKEVELTVQNGVLTIRGEKKEAKEDTKKDYHRVERFFGQFYREVPLPAGADSDKITATSTQGVITIAIPKKPEILPKKIAIKALAT